MGPANSARTSLTPPPSRAGMVLVNRLPGASTSMSAASIDSMTPGGAGIPAGSTETSETCFPTSWTTDSPRVTVPSAQRTTSVRLSVAAGKTRPLILRNRAACSTPSQNPPAMSASAAIIMLPTLWSFRSPGASKRYSNTSASLRRPASATRQFLTSPGGATPSSWRRRPLEPPSSATVTTAVRSPTLSLKPLSNTGKPVPPPNATIFKFSTLRMGPEYTARRKRLGEESCPFVRPGEIEDRTTRHDVGGVDALVAPVVVLLYAVHIDSLHHTRLITKYPTVLTHKGPDRREPYNLLQPFQSVHDRRPVCPRACLRDVQMIPVRRRRKPAAPVGRDPIPKTRGLAHEPPVRVLPLPLGLPLALYKNSRYLPPFGRQVSGCLH